jgi:hypothetical protein
MKILKAMRAGYEAFMKTLTQEEKPLGESDEGMEEDSQPRPKRSSKKAKGSGGSQRRPSKAKAGSRGKEK